MFIHYLWEGHRLSARGSYSGLLYLSCRLKNQYTCIVNNGLLLFTTVLHLLLQNTAVTLEYPWVISCHCLEEICIKWSSTLSRISNCDWTEQSKCTEGVCRGNSRRGWVETGQCVNKLFSKWSLLFCFNVEHHCGLEPQHSEHREEYG